MISWFSREFLNPRRAIFNIIFYGLHIGLFAYGWYSQATNERLAGLNKLQYSVWVSRGAGLALAFDGGLIMLPMLRNILRAIRPKLVWLISMDENIWFHRQVAYSMACWTVVHVTAHYVNFIKVERTQLRQELAVQIHYNQAGGITGHFMVTVMIIMYSLASRQVRTQCFEAFWYSHHLAFFFMLALFSHATGCFVRDSPNPAFEKHFPFYNTEHCLGYESWRFIIWPFVLYFGERVYREVRARRATSLDKVLLHPSGAIELRMTKPSLKFTPGQWIFVQIPSVSSLQWHPFSISSAPEDPYLAVTICPVGDWTETVSQAVGAGPSVVAALQAATANAEAAQHVYDVVDKPPPLYKERDPIKKDKDPFASLRSPEERVQIELERAARDREDSIARARSFGSWDANGPLPPGSRRPSTISSDGRSHSIAPGVKPSDQFYEVVAPSAPNLNRQSQPTATQLQLPKIRIDGPYGAPSQDVFKSDLAVLVGGGIGVTPFASILKHIWYRQRAGKLGTLRHVEFIWVCREPRQFAWFNSVLREIEDAQIDPNFLRISMYITQKLSIDQLYNIAINTGPGTEYDPLTRLRTRTFYGRPDFSTIYRRIRDAVEIGAFVGPRETSQSINIGTFFCGPSPLGKVVKQNALACSTQTANFTFAKEHF